MKMDKKRLYLCSTLLVLALLASLFFSFSFGKVITALILVAFAIVIFKTIKKRPILSINKREVLFLIAVISVVYLVLYYLTGLHFGFYKTAIPFSLSTFFNHIVPSTAIIISIEIIRYVLLAQESKAISVLAYVAGVISEVVAFSSLGYVTTFNRFMDMVGIVFLPAITANFLYCYISRRYGAYPNIAFRFVITVYTYIIPVYPAIPESLYAFSKLLLPLLAYVFIHSLYEKKSRFVKRKNKILGGTLTVASVALMVSIVMLISCQFSHGLLVIATHSMTGELNKGDAVIYEAYDDQYIQEEDIVVFRKNDILVVHRVVDIERINDQNRYYTKGDANDARDDGYITDENIEGIVLFKISYIGYPSLWIRDLFKNI